jgi:hypothetical protein
MRCLLCRNLKIRLIGCRRQHHVSQPQQQRQQHQQQQQQQQQQILKNAAQGEMKPTVTFMCTYDALLV